MFYHDHHQRRDSEEERLRQKILESYMRWRDLILDTVGLGALITGLTVCAYLLASAIGA